MRLAIFRFLEQITRRCRPKDVHCSALEKIPVIASRETGLKQSKGTMIWLKTMDVTTVLFHVAQYIGKELPPVGDDIKDTIGVQVSSF